MEEVIGVVWKRNEYTRRALANVVPQKRPNSGTIIFIQASQHQIKIGEKKSYSLVTRVSKFVKNSQNLGLGDTQGASANRQGQQKFFSNISIS